MNKMINPIFGLIATLALVGCATGPAYLYDGKKYTSKDEFMQAVEANNREAVASVVALTTPLTTKKLIFGMPSESVLRATMDMRYTSTIGKEPPGNIREFRDNLNASVYKGIKVFFDSARKKNIYSSVQFVDLDSMSGSIAPSLNDDVIYFVEPSQGSGQWYYASAKHGKQIFAYDRSSQGASGKVRAFTDALQAQAIRD